MRAAATTVIPPTDPGDVPVLSVDRNAREGVIRDLYALAAFYSSHPDHPLPRSIQVHHRVHSATQLEAIASEYAGGHIYGDLQQQCDHTLAGTATPVMLLVSLPDDSGRPL